MRATLAAALALACGVQPPDSVTVDPTFSDEQRLEIEDGLSHWCRAVGHCPELLPEGGELQIRAAHGRPTGGDTHYDWSSGDFEIFIDMARPFMNGAENGLWRAVAHELGHTGAGGDHAADGLMELEQEWNGPRCVDQAAVDLWCDEQLCPTGASATCP